KSTSPYGFPVVLAQKRDEVTGEKTESRMCIDYRKLNEITESEYFPMPVISDISDRLLHARYFTTLDISAGYHHVEVAQEDRKATAFVTCNNLYQWTRIPFGMKNSGIVFQRVIYNILMKHELVTFAH